MLAQRLAQPPHVAVHRGDLAVVVRLPVAVLGVGCGVFGRRPVRAVRRREPDGRQEGFRPRRLTADPLERDFHEYVRRVAFPRRHLPAVVVDILMANIHKLKSYGPKVTLHNFYTGTDVEIRLKPALSPQKNAEIYYRKYKNQFREIHVLEENIVDRENRLTELTEIEKLIAECESPKDLKQLKSRVSSKINSKSSCIILFLIILLMSLIVRDNFVDAFLILE